MQWLVGLPNLSFRTNALTQSDSPRSNPDDFGKHVEDRAAPTKAYSVGVRGFDT